MPQRPRPHILEELSIRRFGDALPSAWAYRAQTPDYGIDGGVEIFEDAGPSTGLAFNIQLRATDKAAKADRVRLEIDELDYYRSLDLPTAVVRYCSITDDFYWQWASNIRSRVDIAEGQKTVTYRFGESERWTETTPDIIRRTLEVRRGLVALAPSAALPLRIDLDPLPQAARYAVDRAFAAAISASHGVLVRAGSDLLPVEISVRPEPAYLAVGIDTLTGVTFDLIEPAPEDYVTATLYALVRLLHRQRLARQAEAVAHLLIERGLPSREDSLGLSACQALARDLPALVRLAVINGFHDQSHINHGPIALTISQAPQGDEGRRAAMDAFFEASVAAARGSESNSEAAAHYSIGNFYRSQQGYARALSHYNRARRLRPAYWRAGYFSRDLGSILFLAGHYAGAVCGYREALRIDGTGEAELVFLFGDALMLSGAIDAARSAFEDAAARCTAPAMIEEAELKLMLCDWLVARHGVTVPRRRAEANAALRAGVADPTHLAALARDVDALHPELHFRLGVAGFQEGEREGALIHFLLSAFIDPGSETAWANAAISAMATGDEAMMLRILTIAIHHKGAEAYDKLRADLVGQDISDESLAALDATALAIIAEAERPATGGFTLRMLDGDDYHTMTIKGLGGA
ncbi:DUF4365 domain-containing protein [Sphingopyxis sp. JAI128]|uniref:DUF4365 domain-containing protein n=1 Tax=Sphingopyxis sp. JAI128 TaxID=2723066 RepID=UPI00160BF970|nr:DUF4365 domain-containing protein [Sphingopyxis sp. JAI128]MBB6428049.1 tetratricopeptide (TPR) repeat protein [Sphingopyxis sp. JAI128]